MWCGSGADDPLSGAFASAPGHYSAPKRTRHKTCRRRVYHVEGTQHSGRPSSHVHSLRSKPAAARKVPGAHGGEDAKGDGRTSVVPLDEPPRRPGSGANLSPAGMRPHTHRSHRPRGWGPERSHFFSTWESRFSPWLPSAGSHPEIEGKTSETPRMGIQGPLDPPHPRRGTPAAMCTVSSWAHTGAGAQDFRGDQEDSRSLQQQSPNSPPREAAKSIGLRDKVGPG